MNTPYGLRGHRGLHRLPSPGKTASSAISPRTRSQVSTPSPRRPPIPKAPSSSSKARIRAASSSSAPAASNSYGAAANGKVRHLPHRRRRRNHRPPQHALRQAREVTAEVLEPTQANFIRRDAFLGFLRHHGRRRPQKSPKCSSHIYYATCQEIRYLGLAGSAVEKFARFLLDLKPPKGAAEIPGLERRTLTLTHEEIAEMIGTSRETVSRLITGFKRKNLIELHGSSLLLTNKKALEEFRQA